MVDEGYAATQILSQLHESIIEQELSDKQKSAVTEKMAVSDVTQRCLWRSCSLTLFPFYADVVTDVKEGRETIA